MTFCIIDFYYFIVKKVYLISPTFLFSEMNENDGDSELKF